MPISDKGCDYFKSADISHSWPAQQAVVVETRRTFRETIRSLDRIMTNALMHTSGDLTMPDGTAPAVASDQPILLTLLNRLEQAFVRDDRTAAVELLLAAKCILIKDNELSLVQSLDERLHDVRLQLCDSVAVIDVARRAISADDDWHLHHAMQVAIDRIDAACTALDLIAGEAREASQSNDRPNINEPGAE
jgi:hypothetical protein